MSRSQVEIGWGKLALHIFPKDHQPPHVHVIGPDCAAKIDIQTQEVMQSEGISARDLGRICAIIALHVDILMEEWNALQG